jgi:hypothetical protein
MRVFLALIFSLTVVFAVAQPDSILLHQSYFIVGIPADWSIVLRNHGIQSGDNTNFLIRHKTENETSISGIFVKFINTRDLYQKPSRKEQRQANRKNSISKRTYIEHYLGINIISTDKHPASNGNEFQETFIYQLNNHESVIIGYYSRGTGSIEDSLHQAYYRFRDDFFKFNSGSLRKMQPMLFNSRKIISDSILINPHYLIFEHTHDWKFQQITDSMQKPVALLTHDFDHGNTEMRITCIRSNLRNANKRISVDTAKYRPGLRKGLEGRTSIPEQLTFNPNQPSSASRRTKDTVGIYVFAIAESLPFQLSVTDISSNTFTADCYDVFGYEYELNLSVTIKTNSELHQVYYLELARQYLARVLSKNYLRTVKENKP